MFRMRRYRVYIIFAVIAVGALYHFTSLGDLESAGAASVEGLKNFGQKVESSVPPTNSNSNIKDAFKPEGPNVPIAAPSLADSGNAKESQAPAVILKPEAPSKNSQVPAIAEKSGEPAEQPAPTKPASKNDEDVVNPKATPAGKPAPPIGSASTNKTSKPHTGPADPITGGEGGRLEVIADASIPKIHWSQMPEHFPVPTKLLIQLPTGKSKAIPKIQYEFALETSEEKIAREKKRSEIKEAFLFSWAGYKKKAWMQDELSPVSGKYRNPFCAWGATLVDSLDTLYMMGLMDEFEEAVEAVKDIDFTTSPRNEIPLFETVIRYLGGLVAAYDISDGAYRILLDKAVELAEILIGAFDTPNRMPMTLYPWKPTFASQPHRAKTRVVLAELGSLSVEFTRLAQITKEDKYYDAIARITNEFEIWQNNTRIPGLWPMSVDASGCKKPAVSPQGTNSHTEPNAVTNNKSLDAHDSETAKTPRVADEGFSQETIAKDVESKHTTVQVISDEPDKASSPHPLEAASSRAREGLEIDKTPFTTDLQGGSAGAVGVTPASPEATDLRGAIGKREITTGTGLDTEEGIASKPPECEPQGLASPPFTSSEQFGIGGQADSTYEYLPKEYLLLGGLEDQYRTMYEAAADTITKELLYRAMIPDSKRRILQPGLARVADTNPAASLKPEGSHLGCFAGGMYALGAKIFNRGGDMKIAKELTDGCVWAYESTVTGIMPETFLLVACRDPAECPWNETFYHETLDPSRESREKMRVSQLAQQQAVLAADGDLTSIRDNDASELSVNVPTTDSADQERATIDERKASQSTEGVVGKPATPAAEWNAERPMSVAVGGAVAEQPLSPPTGDAAVSKSHRKRQLGDLAPPASAPSAEVKDTLVDATPVEPAKESNHALEIKTSEAPVGDTTTTGPPATTMDRNYIPSSKSATNGTLTGAHPVSQASPHAPAKLATHDEFVQARIKDEKLPKGMTKITGGRYLLRPEAIESVFIMFRATGDDYWRDRGWDMFKAVEKYTNATFGASAIVDVTSEKPVAADEMESFWLAETLKYFYLLFSEPTLVSLDDYVLNTEAHPFKRPK